MLTELKLTNFRIFDDEVTVRFKPITVLIGKNSAGKSSIIKFLLMLQQSLDPGRSQFLTAEGDKVSLGAFPELKNALSSTRKLDFEFTIQTAVSEPSLPLASYLASTSKDEYESLLYRGGGSVTYNRQFSNARSRFSLIDQIKNTSLLKINIRKFEGSTFWEYEPKNGWPQPLIGSSDNQQSNKRNIRELNRRIKLLDTIMAESELVSTMRHQFNTIRHLSPVRDESLRVILASYPADDSVGQQGQDTLPHLQSIVNEKGERYAFLRPHLRNVANIDALEFKTSAGSVTRAVAKNYTTGADVLIADYGFGVSQCLPIFVQGAIMAPHTTLMVEQPEAQLHPTAQLELGSYFADLWKHRNVSSIIETHSDNILLRLRRLIAKRELSHEDVSVAFFSFDEGNGNTPVIKNLDINEDGSIEAGLPMEFFGADIIEALSLGARQ